jgi:hypothetical protein
LDCSFCFSFGVEEPGIWVDCVDPGVGGAWGVGFMGCWARALGSAASERTSRAEAQRDGIVRGQPDEGRAITDWPASILGLHPRPLETPFEPKPPSS